jgi:aspartyl/asparaginyl beta-hydroxylase (cupin superfamily)
MDVDRNSARARLEERARDAFRGRDPARALALLSEAEGLADGLNVSAQLFLDKALALRMLGRHAEALDALNAALVREPSHFLALLSKGAVLEHLGRDKESVTAYKAAVTVAPPRDGLPPAMAAALAKAADSVAAASDKLGEHLKASVADLRARFPEESLDRFDESLDIFSGTARAFVQAPLLLHYPRLPAIPFYDRSHFPWLADLEAASDTIRRELTGLRDRAIDQFAPYVAFRPGMPVNQWAELNNSFKWSAFFLWRNGDRQESACDLCPETAAILASLPMADQPGFAPTAMFSVLDPRTAIPPHTGSTNTRLVVHLPLTLPGPARFRVGNVTREWKMGEAWVFDDTIEHEAHNDADEPRAILIFDVWNPFLSEAERALVAAMMAARKAYDVEA